MPPGMGGSGNPQEEQARMMMMMQMIQSGNFSVLESMMPGPMSGIPVPGTGTKENP